MRHFLSPRTSSSRVMAWGSLGGWRERGESEGREGEKRGKGEEGGLVGRMSITWHRSQRELNRSEVDGEVTRGDFKQIFCQNICVKKREESRIVPRY